MTADMRVVAEIPHRSCKITVFCWNSKYLLKLEQGPLEQTYKISELDVDGDSAVKKLVADERFLAEALLRFGEMGASLGAGLERL